MQYTLSRAEFLQVTVSASCDGAKFSWFCAKFKDLYVQPEKSKTLINFLNFWPVFIHFMSLFCVFFQKWTKKIWQLKKTKKTSNSLENCTNSDAGIFNAHYCLDIFPTLQLLQNKPFISYGGARPGWDMFVHVCSMKWLVSQCLTEWPLTMDRLTLGLW